MTFYKRLVSMRRTPRSRRLWKHGHSRLTRSSPNSTNVSALSERSRQKPVDSYRKLLVRFDERRVKYDFGELDEISLAYAVTIHKSRARSSQPWLSRSPP